MIFRFIKWRQQLHDDIIIRSMKVDDIPAIYVIEEKGHLFPWSQGILHDCVMVGYSCWVIEMAKVIVGYAIMSFNKSIAEAHLLNICIDPAFQRRGYATCLLNHLLNQARQQQLKMIFLEVRASNKAAIQLYDGFGFNSITVRKDYYPAAEGREDAIMMALHLF